MTQPPFHTRRLVLRPRTHADTEACMAMDRDPLVTRFIPGPWGDAAAHRAFITERTRGPYPPGLGYWSVFSGGADARFVGWILLIPEDTTGPDVEIGWRLERAAWGKGLATEAARPVLAYAFERLGVARVAADIDPGNTASIRVAEKLGLRAGKTALRAGALHLRYTMTRTAFAASAS